MDGVPAIGFDWKSDVNPSDATREAYRSQLLEYLTLTGARRRSLVYMSREPIEFEFVSLDGGD